MTSTDYVQMADLVNTYESLPPGTTDTADVAVAELPVLTGVVALDRRHLTVVRPRTRMR